MKTSLVYMLEILVAILHNMAETEIVHTYEISRDP